MSEIPVKEKASRRRGKLYYTWKRLIRNKGAVLGMVIMLFFCLMMLFADVLYDYEEEVIKPQYDICLEAPSLEHPLGTDELGRDVLARIVYGSRYTILISLASVFFAVVVGGFLGAVAGFYDGRLSNLIMRLMDILLAIPGTLLALVMAAALGTSVTNLVIACGVGSVPKFARILRSSILSERSKDYVESSRALGAKESTILVRHVLPNSIAPLFVQTTLSVGTIALLLAGISFLGLGIQPPTPEWGAMLSSARTYIRDYGYLCIFPGLAIMLCILALNLLGDGLRDALDPRLK